MHATDAKMRVQRVRRILVWIFFANAALVAVKIGIGLMTGSISVLGDAAHSGTDALNNLVALTAIYFAAAPPDERHPYGHSKFETLGAFIIAGLLSVTCYEILRTAISRLLRDAPPPDVNATAMIVLAATVPFNLAIAIYERRRGEQLGSELLKADARHTSADVWVTLSVLGGLGLVRLGFQQADALLAILVAGVVAYSGWEILRMTVPVLVDERAVDPLRIHELAATVDGVEGVFGVRSRGRPGEGFAELTVRVRPATHVREAHAIADEVERRLEEGLELRDVIVHVEPSELH